MRNAPFSYDDDAPLRPIQRGGGHCRNDNDCGANVKNTNFTAIYEGIGSSESQHAGRGACVHDVPAGFFGVESAGSYGECFCNEGYTGPHCLALDHWDNFPSAHKLGMGKSPFKSVADFRLPGIMWVGVTGLILMVLFVLVGSKKDKTLPNEHGYYNTEQQPLLHMRPPNEPRGTSV